MAIYTLYFLGYYWPSYLHKCIKWILNAEKSIFFLPSIVINCLFQWFIFSMTYTSWIWINYSPYILLFVGQNGIKIQIQEWKINKNIFYIFASSGMILWWKAFPTTNKVLVSVYHLITESFIYYPSWNENLLLLASDFI